jgi:hypothetical protein
VIVVGVVMTTRMNQIDSNGETVKRLNNEYRPVKAQHRAIHSGRARDSIGHQRKPTNNKREREGERDRERDRANEPIERV